MHRLLAIVPAFVLAFTTGQGSALHIHLYTDHDHPDHHHGLAAHEHHRSATYRVENDAAPHLESCDPGEHVVSITMGCAPLPHARVIDAEYERPEVVEPLITVRSVHPITDVRVHGPPPLTRAASRAPPLNSPA